MFLYYLRCIALTSVQKKMLKKKCDFVELQKSSGAILLKQTYKNLSTLTSDIEFCQATHLPVSQFASWVVLQSTVIGKSQQEAENPALSGGLSYTRHSALSQKRGTLITTVYNSQVEQQMWQYTRFQKQLALKGK